MKYGKQRDFTWQFNFHIFRRFAWDFHRADPLDRDLMGTSYLAYAIALEAVDSDCVDTSLERWERERDSTKPIK